MGELDHFPPEAQKSIREWGGLQTFLLQSPRFIGMGGRIGVCEHAVARRQVEGGAGLDQLDDLEHPPTKPTFPNPHAPAFISHPHVIVSDSGDVDPVLPSSSCCSSPPAAFPHAAHPFAASAATESSPRFTWADVDPQQAAFYDSPNDVEEVDLYSAEAEDDPSSSSTAAEENVLWKHAAVQVRGHVHPEERRAARAFNILSSICSPGFPGDEERRSQH